MPPRGGPATGLDILAQGSYDGTAGDSMASPIPPPVVAEYGVGNCRASYGVTPGYIESAGAAGEGRQCIEGSADERRIGSAGISS